MPSESYSHPLVESKLEDLKTLRAVVAVVGEQAVGKTALLAPSPFPRAYVPTLTPAVSSRLVRVPGGVRAQADLLFVEIPGSALCDAATADAALNRARALLAVYSVDSRASLAAAGRWARRALAAPGVADGGVRGALVGAKLDLRSAGRGEVTADEGAALAATLGLAFFEASAEAGIGLDAPLEHLAAELARAESDE